MEAQHLAELPADLVQGRQGGHGFLKDHADPGAANAPQALDGQGQQVFAGEHCRAPDEAGRWARHQAQDALCGHGLAGTGLAHQAYDFTGPYVETDIVHSLDNAFIGVEMHREILD